MVMVRVMYKRGHVMSLQYTMSNEELRCMGFVFVDDTDLIVIGNKNYTKETVCRKQQQGMECWERTLEVTGGALKAAKCYWYLVNFAWKDGEWFYKQTENHSCKIAGDENQGYSILSLPVN